MGWYDGRSRYYGRRHGGGFFLFPLIFVGMALLFMRGFFFFMPLIVLGFFVFVAFMFLRPMIFGNRRYDGSWGYGEKRKNSSAYFIGEDGERHEIIDEEKNKPENPDDIEYV